MPALALYLMKLSVSLSVVWIFYQLLLRRLTFYSLNRWYLLFYSLLSFFIPLIDVGRMIGQETAGAPMVIRLIPSITPYEAPAVVPVVVHSSFRNVWVILLFAVLLGSCILLMRMVISWVSLQRLRKRATGQLADLPAPLGNEGVLIYQVDEPIAPFSFGNAVFLNRELYSEHELKEIILHEYVHIRQKHTMDILLAELFVILNWYNPFVWLMRHSIRQNLEFIADQQVLAGGLDRKSYQYHLLKVVGQSPYRLVNKFNFSSLKKRIIMMNKIRSARLHLVKFLFILPLIAVLAVAFRNKYNGLLRGKKELAVNVTGIITDDRYFKPLEGATVVDKISGMSTVTDAKGFYRLHIPASSGQLHLRLQFEKSGYTPNGDDYSCVIQEPRGIIFVEMLHLSSDKNMYISVPAFANEAFPVDPGYEDALTVLQAKINKQRDLQSFISMQTGHPEVAMFYTTEDKQKHLVIRKDGMVERYGYAGGPAIRDMEEKYGPLPELMRHTPVGGKGYYAQWERISMEAQKTFHTKAGGVKEVIFPGDSRVIVVPVTGGPQVYDMDNADPKERTAFEQIYGKLPDCVPPPSIPAPVAHHEMAATVAGADTGGIDPHAIEVGVDHGEFYAGLKGAAAKDNARLLYIIDGVPGVFDKQQLTMKTVYAVDVLTGEKARALYGERGKNGAIAITTRNSVGRDLETWGAPQSPNMLVSDKDTVLTYWH